MAFLASEMRSAELGLLLPRSHQPPAQAQQPKRPVRADLVESFVLEVYGAVRLEGRLADRALDPVLRGERRLYSAERRAIAEGVWGLLRSERRTDFGLFGRSPPDLRGTALHRAR